MVARATRGPGDLLTIQQAADRLGVHYMTVYRRIRLGMLPATKVGGSWRVDPADLAPAPRAGGTVRAPAVAGRTSTAGASRHRRSAPWAERLGQRMLAGDGPGSWQLVEAAMASGVEPRDVYVEILGPALHDIGAAWQRGKVGVDQEHLASGVAASIIGRLGPRFRRRGRHRGAVLVAMPAGERHGLGVAMLGDILAEAGFEVLNLGPDTPPASLASAMAARDDVGAIVISVVDSTHLQAAARLVAAARRADPGVPIVAGGFAVTDAAAALRLGADGWEVDPRRLGERIDTLRAR